MAHPWQYGYRQYLPPDDLPEDFAEGQDDGEDDEEAWPIGFPKKKRGAD